MMIDVSKHQRTLHKANFSELRLTQCPTANAIRMAVKYFSTNLIDGQLLGERGQFAQKVVEIAQSAPRGGRTHAIVAHNDDQLAGSDGCGKMR